MRTYIFLSIFLTVSAFGAGKKAITPAGARPPPGPFSHAIMTGDYLYVSGQGAAMPDGTFPETTGQQVERCLDKVKAIVEGAGLTMEHVVYAHLYLQNMAAYDDANRVWAMYFPRNPPARATIGVYRLPAGTPVEVTVVAAKDLGRRKIVAPPGYLAKEPVSPGVLIGDRLYLSGFSGRDTQAALDAMAETLKAAAMDFRHMVFVNPYVTGQMPQRIMNEVYARHFEFGNTPARATIEVASLPNGATVEFTGVAIRDLSKRQAVRPKNMAPSATASPCVMAEGTLYCSAKAGFIPGPNGGIYSSTVEMQVRQTMRNLLDGLEEAGMTFADVVSTNVYLDDMDDFGKMNEVYARYFAAAPPARTTVQQSRSVDRKAGDGDRWPALEQISLIAVR